MRRLTDGVIFQAVLTGSLSFSHIHDLAAAHGQSGWKAWLYPLSVDLLTVAAYRKLMAARGSSPTGLTWCAFLLGLAASLAANVLGAWQNPDRLVAVSLGVWPAVAFLVCTLLTHDPAPAGTEIPISEPALRQTTHPVQIAAKVPVLAPVEPATAPPEPAQVPVLPDVSPKFLEWARRVADEHRAATGTPIDLETLRAKTKVNEPLARTVHAYLTTGA